MANHTKNTRKALSIVGQPPTQDGLRLAAVDAREFARLTDAVSFLLTALSFPWQARPFIDALIGASDGKSDEWIVLEDKLLALRCRSDLVLLGKSKLRGIGDTTRIKPYASLTKWVQRTRKTIIQKQIDAGLTLIECKPGGKKKGENVPSEYRLPILYMLSEMQTLLVADPRLSYDRDNALMEAALSVLIATKAEVQGKPRVERFKRPSETPEKYVAMSLTYLAKAISLASLKHTDTRPLIKAFFEQAEAQVNIAREMTNMAPTPGSWLAKQKGE